MPNCAPLRADDANRRDADLLVDSVFAIAHDRQFPLYPYARILDCDDDRALVNRYRCNCKLVISNCNLNNLTQYLGSMAELPFAIANLQFAIIP